MKIVFVLRGILRQLRQQVSLLVFSRSNEMTFPSSWHPCLFLSFPILARIRRNLSFPAPKSGPGMGQEWERKGWENSILLQSLPPQNRWGNGLHPVIELAFLFLPLPERDSQPSFPSQRSGYRVLALELQIPGFWWGFSRVKQGIYWSHNSLNTIFIFIWRSNYLKAFDLLNKDVSRGEHPMKR
jgi:hypothetical protein